MKKNIRSTVLRVLWVAALASVTVAHADTKTRITDYGYDSAGLLTSETREPTIANECLQTTHAYDARGNRTSTTTATCAGASGYTTQSATTSRASSTGYDTEGRFPTSATNPLSQTETRVFEAKFGRVTSLTDANAISTTWLYDSLGRKTRETRPDGTVTTWQYKLCTDSGASCPASVGPAAVVWVRIEQGYRDGTLAVANTPEKRDFYDSLNRVVRSQTYGYDGFAAAPALVQDTEYNTRGFVARKSDWYAVSAANPAWTTFTYDALGRVVTESRPDPSASGGVATTTTTYAGSIVTVTNPLSQTRTTIRNALDQVEQVKDAQNNTIWYAYDALGNVKATSVVAAGGGLSSTTTMAYDLRGNKTAMTDPSMGAWQYGYNAYGEQVYQQDAKSQTVAMEYDKLGRMTKRTEPDLTSEWSFDKNFDTSACGKGIGKLCEARANNSYNRKHTYDTAGRVATTTTLLNSATTAATVSLSYNSDGRVATKTWPTGYQATNTYTTLGYLKTVTGGGTAGFAQTVTYNVLAMNAHGQITQYRYGNPGSEVTMVRTLQAQTDRIMALVATKAGQANGNVLSQSYSYDALGNLTARADGTSGVGTSETFVYDNLNRLTTAYLMGGGGGATPTTTVAYNALGNITFKSDLGSYAYADAARPDRLTSVSHTAPGGSTLTGNRTMGFAYDGGLTGNGNVTSIATQDLTKGLNTQRTLAYASFNMPTSIGFANVGVGTCPPGYTLSTGQCTAVTSSVPATITGYTCPGGYTLAGSNCTSTTIIAATPVYQCPGGYTLSGATCSTTVSIAASATPYCPAGLSYNPSTATCDMGRSTQTGMCAASFGGTPLQSWSQFPAGPEEEFYLCRYTRLISYSCPSGYSLSGSTCYATATTSATIASYSCPAGYAVSGSSCIQTNNVAGTPVYSCSAGQTLSGNNCLTTATVPAYTAHEANSTSTFVYGPEHQRVRRTVAFTGAGAKASEPGSTWYLNGEDSLGLTYEREVRDNGTTEHRHFVSAGGVTFALFVSRTGTLNGLPAASTSYLHHDHLGSTAAVTDESGNVAERLAYDPWGKRRFIASSPGKADELDLIAGGRTDRGYTMHEHLDEVGLVHMNARIQEPHLGRFLTPDPIVQAPYNSKSFNRYSYVWNNPLKLWDPSGYYAVESVGQSAKSVAEQTIEAFSSKKEADDKSFSELSAEPVSGDTSVAILGNLVKEGVKSLVNALRGVAQKKAAEEAAKKAVAEEAAAARKAVEEAAAARRALEQAAARRQAEEAARKAQDAAAKKSANDAAVKAESGARHPASEKQARDIAKQIEKDLGKEARREFHDAKQGGLGDRTMQELKDDARTLYEEAGKAPPSWMQ